MPGVLPYAAYLRVYEPLAAFPEPARTGWARYADSPDRPRRANALAEEHAQAVRRMAAEPPLLAPERESGDAYIRRTATGTYICPWQTRLRSWTAVERLRETAPAGLTRSVGPADATVSDFALWKRDRASIRTHIRSSRWQVPPAWFVPFMQAERWLVLGPPESVRGLPGTAPARTLLYVTAMPYARQRTARAADTVRRAFGEGEIFQSVASVGRWLTEFHPDSLVELDYGGLVHLLDDQALCADESVAEVATALAGLERGEEELAIALYTRLRARWRSVRALESAN